MTPINPENLRKCSAVVAMTSRGRAIGKKGDLPWGSGTLRKDLQFFKRVTSDTTDETKQNAVVMGRKTWDSIPEKYRPLAGRKNVVVSRTLSESALPGGVSLARSLEAALDADEGPTIGSERVFIVGGSEIYAEALRLGVLESLYVTEVHAEYEGCDAFFPEIPLDEFDGPTPAGPPPAEDNEIPYTFSFYSRKKTTTGSPLAPLNSTTTTTTTSSSASGNGANQPRKRALSGDHQLEKTTPTDHEEYQYLNLVREILDKGVVKMDRTGTGTKSVFGRSMRFSLREGALPLLTTKKTFFRGVAVELLWFLSGDTSAKTLQDQKVTIWDGNSSRAYLDSIGLKDREEGDLGPVYGFQWRHFGAEYKTMHDDYTGKGVDQITELIKTIRTNPDSRRMIVSAWNPSALPHMALPPCHVLSQFYVANGELSCQMYQRSADMGLGVPFNIASYALLTHILARMCGLKAGDFIHAIGDCHVYLNHESALKEQLEREPRPFPKLVMKFPADVARVEDIKYEDFEVVDYNPHKAIKMDMAV